MKKSFENHSFPYYMDSSGKLMPVTQTSGTTSTTNPNWHTTNTISSSWNLEATINLEEEGMWTLQDLKAFVKEHKLRDNIKNLIKEK